MHEHAHRVPQATRAAPLPAASRTFPATARHIGEARRFLAAILDSSTAADDAIVCLSELASNATTHSNSRRPGGTFTVCAQVKAGCLRVEVHDEGGPGTIRSAARTQPTAAGYRSSPTSPAPGGEPATVTPAGGSGSRWNARD